MTMACLHMLLSQGRHVLQTSEPTVLCSSLRLVPVDSAAVSLLTYINKTNKCSNFERQRQVICACYYFAGQAITEICARIGWHALTHPHKAVLHNLSVTSSKQNSWQGCYVCTAETQMLPLKHGCAHNLQQTSTARQQSAYHKRILHVNSSVAAREDCDRIDGCFLSFCLLNLNISQSNGRRTNHRLQFQHHNTLT